MVSSLSNNLDFPFLFDQIFPKQIFLEEFSGFSAWPSDCYAVFSFWAKLGNVGLIRDQQYRTEPRCRNNDAGLRQLTTRRKGISLSTSSSMDVQGVSLSTAISMNLQGVLVNHLQWGDSVRYRNAPVPECSGTRLRYRMPECRWRRHRPRCRCPAMSNKYLSYMVWISSVYVLFWKYILPTINRIIPFMVNCGMAGKLC